ncbi:hypothetical protein D9757_007744 [Collybiopsis confluens]|uniref:tRNA (guanine(26)-N(2))-dimethyltransferase n=1 Tax=Collybiopsis confluens TaxID=2823264 RepID=A0A8H5H5C5_9AGAR|nr:hypothetical protein D9757_007744 [Collybiopsis confluens]
MSSSTTPTIPVPDGFRLHTENNAHILMSENEAFLNPVQEFNRDLSVACIRTWSSELNKTKQERKAQAQEKRALKDQDGSARKRQKGINAITVESESEEPAKLKFDYKITILEALSATGLRSIRYAKEIPLVKYVLANDLSSTAVAAMKRNVDLNGLGPKTKAENEGSVKLETPGLGNGKVRVNEGDACVFMYSHRTDKVDVVDLDPYGTAAPFIDAAVQAVKDEGLLCVTCTDVSILATNNYPEKCFSNYGGLPMKAEYSHEAVRILVVNALSSTETVAQGLRLVLHAVSTSASRYGRYIEPLLSLSIDFYVRLFIRVNSSPFQVKKALTKTSTYFICTSCQSFYDQPLGRVVEKKGANDNVNLVFKTQPGPPVGSKCPECDSNLHLAGPMWSGPIHDTAFVSKILQHTEACMDQYGTATRMQGMLTVAKEELHAPFYFTPTKVASFFHCQTPSLDDTASALLHAGHQVSRSHAIPGSLKTTASSQDIMDVFRSWVKTHPIKNVSETSPALRLLAKEPRTEANFEKHPGCSTLSSKVKITRYQETPANWGPGSKPGNNKRKRT